MSHRVHLTGPYLHTSQRVPPAEHYPLRSQRVHPPRPYLHTSQRVPLLLNLILWGAKGSILLDLIHLQARSMQQNFTGLFYIQATGSILLDLFHLQDRGFRFHPAGPYYPDFSSIMRLRAFLSPPQPGCQSIQGYHTTFFKFSWQFAGTHLYS